MQKITRQRFASFITIVTILFLLPISGYCQDENLIDHMYLKAKVLNVEEERVETDDQKGTSQGLFGQYVNQIVTVEILDGEYKGIVYEASHVIMNQPGYDIIVEPGDEVVLYVEHWGGEIENVYIADHARDKQLLYLLGIFALILVVVGRMQGIKTIITLGITIGAIYWILFPLLFKGYNPIIVTVLVAALVTTVILTIIGGLSVKTAAAIIGTTGGVFAAGVLAMLFGTAAHLTGFSNEEVRMLIYIPQKIEFDIRGILFSGMIIGALGAVMDVGMSIASAVSEIKKANPSIQAVKLINGGMNVGRDIMGTMANTLILAYTGGAIPLILVFIAYNTPFIKIANLDLIATEIVRALVGSIGLIIAIPVTAVVAGVLSSMQKEDKS